MSFFVQFMKSSCGKQKATIFSCLLFFSSAGYFFIYQLCLSMVHLSVTIGVKMSLVPFCSHWYVPSKVLISSGGVFLQSLA
jgi:hypothetical protein